MRLKPLVLAASLGLLILSACRPRSTPYETSTPEQRAKFKLVPMPLPAGTPFTISQGAFGKNTHSEPGQEYSWDFDVPLGTSVLSVEDGTVLAVWEPDQGGGCDAKLSNDAHNVKVKHRDGTVAQYVHIQSKVTVGSTVKKGQKVAVTAKNGFICTPQLHFGIYQDERHLFGSKEGTRTIPLLFDGLPDGGMAHEGFEGAVP